MSTQCRWLILYTVLTLCWYFLLLIFCHALIFFNGLDNGLEFVQYVSLHFITTHQCCQNVVWVARVAASTAPTWVGWSRYGVAAGSAGGGWVNTVGRSQMKKKGNAVKWRRKETEEDEQSIIFKYYSLCPTKDVTISFLVCPTKNVMFQFLEKVLSHMNIKIIFSLSI